VSTSGSRRKFLKTIGSAAIASALPRTALAGKSEGQVPPPSVAVFWEPEFPEIQGCQVTRDILQQALATLTVHYLSEQELITRLNAERFDLFINPFGSAFPKRAWPAILKYLQGGGNWLNIGGVPLSRPVVRDGTSWRVEPHQTSYHKRLGITQSFPVTDLYGHSGTNIEGIMLGMAKNEEVYALNVRLSSMNNEPDEAGSDGPREAVLHPVIFAAGPGGPGSKAAAVIRIDRLLREFAGGRWVLANFRGSMDHLVLGNLAWLAAQGASHVEVRTRFACYREGETPSLSIRIHRPKGGLEQLLEGRWYVWVNDTSGKEFWNGNVVLRIENTEATGTVELPRTVKFRPGYYTVQANAPVKNNSYVASLVQNLPGMPTTAFWFYDESVMRRGKPLTVDNHFFYRGGEVFPITGTTYMASDVHRRFLFDPNPAIWNADFSLMRQAGVNMIRTGIWTGWKKYMPAVGQVDEGVLRALDAFLLTAHWYDIPVIFTFFAFLPETWGGANAYLDPRAVKAQQEFISAFTKRYPRTDDVLWDFINEPSFCSPKYLWNCRPNYDEFEKAAWKQWLKDRYPAASDEDRIAHLQQLWRTTADDVLELPQLKDFESVHLIDDRQPLKTLDYRLFAQDMFIRWTREMTKAVRSNGNPKQLITVGQDEAGLNDSPNIQFFAREIDFTSLHNWWANDDLVWDSVLAKTPLKASLMEETGVMFYEKADADAPWRSEEDVARLLERKMVISCAVDGAGFIEWVWNTNPYMNSTNEVGIGFHRVDRSYKPEFLSFIWVAQFMKIFGRAYLRERQPEPVVMVIPHSQMFSPRSSAQEATRRCVRAMYYHCGVPMQAVSEYTLADYSLNAKLIIVPSPGVLTQKCWDALLAAAKGGATVAISGVIDEDEYGQPVARSKLFEEAVKSATVSQSEAIAIGSENFVIRYEGEKMQRIEKAVTRSRAPFSVAHGSGYLVWSPLPLELGDSTAALVAFYKLALAQARIAPIFTAEPNSPSVLIFPSMFRDVVLYTFINETDHNAPIKLTDLATRARLDVTVLAGRTTMVIVDRKSGSILSRDYRSYLK